MSNVRETVRDFIIDNFLFDTEPQDFTDDTDLKENRILDSLSMLRLMTFIEDHFHVQLELEDLESGDLFSLARIEKLVLARTTIAPS